MKKKSDPIWFVLMIVLYQCSSMIRPTLQVRPFLLPEELRHPLPSTVTPEKYKVIIEHHVDAPTPYFKGEVRIEIRCTTPTNNIFLNKAGDIDARAIAVKSLSNSDENKFEIINEHYHDGNQWELVLDKRLEKDERYEIYIKFDCDFYDTQGYILKTFEDDYSNRRVMTFTKLNEFDARRIIPCFDQINMKAKFKIWLLHPKRFTSFSNAAEKSREDINTSTKPNWVKVEFHETDSMATFSIAMALVQFQTTKRHAELNVNVQTWADKNVVNRIDTSDEQNWVKVEFHETKNMATFSIAMALTQFKTTGLHTPSEVNVQTWADENVIDRMLYINILASESFKFFSKLFDVPHPMKKLDILILPDVKFEIEESFGVIFMSQKYVLETLEKRSNIATYDLVLKICHAVSYQWIGSSVTMSQWEETWFHQGLNYFLQKDCAKKFKGRNSDVDQALGVFTKNVDTANPPIITFYGFKIQDIIKSWLLQKGVPVIVAKRDTSENKLIFHQVIFNILDLNKDYKEPLNDHYWIIPLSCTTEKESKFDEVTPRVWLQTNQIKWGPPGEFDKKDWFLCNLEFNVPGRVLYDKKTWNSIRKFLIDESKFKKTTVLTRARLVSDMFTLAEAEQLSYKIVLRTMEYLQYEEEFIPWMIALKEFDRIRSRLLGYDLALLEHYEKFVRMILRAGFQKLMDGNFSQNPESHSVENEFQILFMEISCKFDFEECSVRSSEMNSIWSSISNLHLEFGIERRLRKIVLCEQVKHGNQETWKSLWQQYYEEQSQSSKEDILHAFGCLQKENDLKWLLKKSINDPKITREDSRPNISREDSIIIFQSLVSNKKGYLLMKNFFKEFYDGIKSFHSEGEPSVLSYLRILFDATNKRSHYKEISYFATTKTIYTTDPLTNRSLDSAFRNILWGERNRTDLKWSLRNIKLIKLIKTLKQTLKNKLKLK